MSADDGVEFVLYLSEIRFVCDSIENVDLLIFFSIVHISCISDNRKIYRRCVGFVVIGEMVKLFGIFICRSDKESGSHRIEGASVSDLDLGRFDTILSVFVSECVSCWLSDCFFDGRYSILRGDSGRFIDQ